MFGRKLMKLNIIIFFILSVLLSGCSTQTPTTRIPTDPVGIAPSETSQPASPTDDIPAQETETLPYEFVSPGSIRTKTGVLIEIKSAYIAVFPSQETTFRFVLSFSGLPEDQIPEHSREDSFFLVEDVQFFHGEGEVPLEVEKFGGGGGGGPLDDDTVSVNQSEIYRLPSDFTVGLAEHIVALVTFHEVLGITEPVRFDLEIVPQDGPLE